MEYGRVGQRESGGKVGWKQRMKDGSSAEGAEEKRAADG